MDGYVKSKTFLRHKSHSNGDRQVFTPLNLSVLIEHLSSGGRQQAHPTLRHRKIVWGFVNSPNPGADAKVRGAWARDVGCEELRGVMHKSSDLQAHRVASNKVTLHSCLQHKALHYLQRGKAKFCLYQPAIKMKSCTIKSCYLECPLTFHLGLQQIHFVEKLSCWTCPPPVK